MKRVTLQITFICILTISGCDHSHPPKNPIKIGHQFGTCQDFRTIDDVEVKELATPANFNISPAKAIQIASDMGEFSCGHKLGASIYAGERYYYLVRLGFSHELNLQHDLGTVSVAINGNSGHILEIKYRAQ